jgi:WD40 repeat protein
MTFACARHSGAGGGAGSGDDGAAAAVVCLDGLPNDRLAVVRQGSNTICIQRSDSSPVCSVGEGHGAGAAALAVTVDGRLAVAGFSAGGVRVFDADTGTRLQELHTHGPPTRCASVCALPDSGHVVAAVTDAGDVVTWDLRDGQVVRHWGAGAAAKVVALPGGRVATADADGTVCMWSVQAGAGDATSPEPCAAATPAPGPASPCLAALADGRLAFNGRRNGGCDVCVWNAGVAADDASAVTLLAGHTAPVVALAPLADGRLVSAAADGMRLWCDS